MLTRTESRFQACMNIPQGNGKSTEEGEEPLSRPSLLRAPSLSAADLEVNANVISFTLPVSPLNGFGSIS